jgi:hypothetical protein
MNTWSLGQANTTLNNGYHASLSQPLEQMELLHICESNFASSVRPLEHVT